MSVCTYSKERRHGSTSTDPGRPAFRHSVAQGSVMRVHELMDILSDQPADAEVELAVIAPVDEGSDDITVDRYFVDGVLPWEDDEDDDDDTGGELTIWLVGGEEP